jgi:hypothetical protein
MPSPGTVLIAEICLRWPRRTPSGPCPYNLPVPPDRGADAHRLGGLFSD